MKSKKQYEELFEDLMTYTDFTSTDQIQTREDVRELLAQVRDDSRAKDRDFKITKKLAFQMGEAISRLKGRGGLTKKTRKTRVLESTKTFKNFEDATTNNLTTINQQGIPIYKTLIKRRGKTEIRFRDKNGRFAKRPQEE